MTTRFELQPKEKELQKLADQCWQEAPNRERRLEEEAYEAGEAIRKGIAANRPYLIDVDIAADVNPAGAGVWELPGLGQSKAGIGTRFQPG